jgi:hypothetical protein
MSRESGFAILNRQRGFDQLAAAPFTMVRFRT